MNFKDHSTSAGMCNARLNFLQHCVEGNKVVGWELNYGVLSVGIELVPQHCFVWFNVHPGTDMIEEISKWNVPLKSNLCPA